MTFDLLIKYHALLAASMVNIFMVASYIIMCFNKISEQVLVLSKC